MKSVRNKFKGVFIISFLVLLIYNVSYFSFVDSTRVGWLCNLTGTIAILVLPIQNIKYFNKYEIVYVIILLLGFIFHLFSHNIQRPTIDSFKWICIILVLVSGRRFIVYNRTSGIEAWHYPLLVFFVSHCFISISEYFLKTVFFNYNKTVEGFSYEFETVGQFRAFGLMAHPLYSANVVLIIMSFVLVLKGMNKYVKYGLLLLGTVSLIAYNSRGAMIIWIIVLVYRLFLYNRSVIVGVFFVIVGYIFFINDAFAFIFQQYGNLLGRLAEKNSLSDSSSITRLISWGIFFNQTWNFEDIVVGGRVFYFPGTEISLENGVLLTIAWWGWIVGPMKIVLEVVITWLCMEKYYTKDKIIIIICTWGCANLNNNIVNSFVFAFFVLSYLSLNTYYSKKSKAIR